MKSNIPTILGLVCLSTSMFGCGVEQVDEGYRGIEKKWGKVQDKALPPGLYFYDPISSSIFEMSVKEEKVVVKTSCFTRDTQTVDIEATVTYFPEPSSIHNIYSQFGSDWVSKVIEPAVLGSLKDSVGQYVADELVSKRELVKDKAQTEIKQALATRKVNVTRLDITNLDFNDAYEHAVEKKVVATQQAAEAKNKTVQVEEEAKQTVAKAKAEAESMRIRSQALSQNKGLVAYELATRWSGDLPNVLFVGDKGGNILNLSEIMKDKK